MKKILLFLFALIFLIGIVSALNWDEGLVRYFSLDEINGSVIDKTQTYNATNLVATTGVSGIINTAYNFTNNAQVTLGNNADLDLTDAFTYSLWLNLTNNSPTGRVLWAKNINSGTRAIEVYLDAEKKPLVYLNGTLGFSSNISVNPDRWTHIVLTYNKTEGLVKWYINGSNANQTNFNSSLNIVSSNLTFGQYNLLDSFLGRLDEISVWNRTLNSSEVSELYNNGNGLPFNPFSGAGSGTTADPYNITNCTQLNETSNRLSAVYQLVNNIDCSDTVNWNSGLGWYPIGIHTGGVSFTGVFDGLGYNITDLYYSRQGANQIDDAGLFGMIENATVRNINLLDAFFNSSQSGLGMIGRADNSTIINSSSTGRFIGLNDVGGIVGQARNTTLLNSYSTANISSYNLVSGSGLGGLIGGIYTGLSSIINSYSMGNVTSGTNPSFGGNAMGGAVGMINVGGDTVIIDKIFSSGNVTCGYNCGGLIGYNFSGVINVTNSYWDTQTSNQSTSGGGTGKTTAQMNNLSTFSGWNISQSNINLNNHYPYLGWKGSNNSFIWLISQKYINIISPIYSQVFVQSTAQFNISTTMDMDTCYYQLGSDLVNRTMNQENSTSFNITNTTMTTGTNNVTYSCNESSGGIWRTSETVTFNVTGDESPTLTQYSPANTFNSSLSQVNFTCYASDDQNLANVSLYLNSTGWLNSTNTSGINASNYTFSLNIADGFYKWTCGAVDNASQQTVGTNYTLTVDTTSPSQDYLSPVDNFNSTILSNDLTINITDNIGLKNTSLFVYWVNNTLFHTTDVVLSGTQSLVQTTVNFVDGVFKWFYRVFDYTGNSYNTTNRTITIDTTLPTVSITSPANNTNTSTQTQAIQGLVTSPTSDLTNATLLIKYLNGTQVYSNTTQIFGSSYVPNWSYTFSFNDFLVNLTACDLYGNCNSTQNRLNVFQGNFTISSLNNFNNQVGESTNQTVVLNSLANNYLIYCNTTLVHPNGALLINNVNATKSGNNWISTNTLINSTGVYSFNVSCLDRFGTTYTKTNSTNMSYTLIYSPTNYTFSALVLKNETNSFNVSLFDDSQALINYTITTAIAESGNFTINTSSFILLNSSDSESNPFSFLFSINASNNVGNGTYAGNITLTNSTYNLTHIIYFSYGINPPSGRPSIYDISGNNKCTDDINSVCANAVTLTQGGSVQQSYKIFNDGFYNLTGCVPYLSNEFVGQTFYNFSNQLFNIPSSQSVTISLNLNTNSSTVVNDYRGYMYVDCASSNLLGTSSSTEQSNRPYIRLSLQAPPPASTGGGGGGGGGAPTTKVTVIALIKPASVTLSLTPLQRAIIYSIFFTQDSKNGTFSQDDMVTIKGLLSNRAIYPTFDQLNLLLQAYKNNQIENIQVSETEANQYDLVKQTVVTQQEEFRVVPRIIASYTTICGTSSDKTWTYPIRANKEFASCEVISGNFKCNVDSATQSTISYEFKDTDFFSTSLTGEVRYTSKDGQVDRTSISSLSVINSCYEVKSLGNLNILYIVGLIVVILIVFIVIKLRKKRIKWKTLVPQG